MLVVFKSLIYRTFTKCLLCLFLVCVTANVTGCFCTDCTYSEEKLPVYTNKSGETVKIVEIGEFYTPDRTVRNSYEKFIANGDTLHYTTEEWYVPASTPANIACGGLVLSGNCDKPIRMELLFLNDPQKCLLFDGSIKNDGIDMRSWDSYKRGNKIPDWADFWAGVEYVYTITPEHKAMAKEEYCQSSAGD